MRPAVRVRVMVRVRIGEQTFLQVDPQCINTQQMHMTPTIGGKGRVRFRGRPRSRVR